MSLNDIEKQTPREEEATMTIEDRRLTEYEYGIDT